ncbi:hypothetical protein [Mocis latipes granulovirus]|uniref:Uncharacterized protein n=1 Tax=Mocis latipes granulovirus TaxID=2072024 RepID=A0A162GWT6_9BBAC|nr:hypothetical protein [Mocis latipes granulovirus]AKR17510.1 hypothetical protein [Mocis latipes granulovirus]
MKRHANHNGYVHAKMSKVEDEDIENFMLEAPEQICNVQFKLNCECTVPCDNIIVCVYKENVWSLKMSLHDGHNFVKYQSVFRRYYSHILRVLLPLNFPVGKTLIQVYVKNVLN